MQNLFCGHWIDILLVKSVVNKGMQYTHFIISSDELTVSSQLIVPTTKANNNITVICTLLDSIFDLQSIKSSETISSRGSISIYMYSSFDELHIHDHYYLVLLVIVMLIIPCFDQQL